MGSRRSRNLRAREGFKLEEAFAKIKAEREGKSIEPEKPTQEKPKKAQKDNPNHPCYKCIGCPSWTRCTGYYQLLECMEERKKGYERKVLQ